MINLKIRMFIFVLAGGIFYGLLPAILLAQDKGLEAAQKQAEEGLPKPQDSQAVVLPKVEYRADVMRDPFVWQIKQDLTPVTIQEEQKVVENVPPPPLKVTGILWGGNLPLAIINNKVLKVGDTIEQAKVTSIDKGGVKVLFQNKVFSLSSPTTNKIEELKKQAQGGQK